MLDIISQKEMEVCPQCRATIYTSKARVIQDTCGHRKCRECLILEENGCAACKEESTCNVQRETFSHNYTLHNGKSYINLDTYDDYPFHTVIKFNELDNKLKNHHHYHHLDHRDIDHCHLCQTSQVNLENTIVVRPEQNVLSQGYLLCDKDRSTPIPENLVVSKRHDLLEKEHVCTQSKTNVTLVDINPVKVENLVVPQEKNGTQLKHSISLSETHNNLKTDVVQEGSLPIKPEHSIGCAVPPTIDGNELLPTLLKDVKLPVYHKETENIVNNHGTKETNIHIEEAPLESKDPQKIKEKKKRTKLQPKSHIKVLSSIPAEYCCTVCNKTFSNRLRLRYHNFCGSDNKPYKCELCHQTFISSSHYEYHLRNHAGIKPYICDICDKGFNQKGKLTRHIRSHTGKGNHVCEECGKTYQESSTLRSHLHTHSGEKRFVCAHCGKKFTERVHLRKHEITHTGEKAVVCDQCGKKFGYRWLLILHQRTHSQERPHQCPVCSRAFCKKQDMKRHHLTHTTIKSFECTTCNMLFRRKDNLERHLKNTHVDQTKTHSSKLEPHHIKDKPPNLPRPPPRCLEDLLDLPSSVQSSNSSTHCNDTQAVQINNALMFKQIEPQTKNKGGKNKQLMEGTKTKESQPSFRQIIYSNFQINDSFKQIPVLDTQDKTVICKAMSVINKPAATALKEAPVENTTKCVKTVSIVRNAKKTYSDKRMHTYNEAANCVRTITRVPELLPKDPEPPQIKYPISSQKQFKTVEKPQPCEENFDKHITNIPDSIHCKNKQIDIQKELAEIPSKMVGNYSEPVLTVLPEQYKCPLTVDVNFDEPYILPVTNVIKSCGQPSVLKVLHDLHWRKRTMEMLKQRQYLSPDIENAYG